jgi:hypothetical protein
MKRVDSALERLLRSAAQVPDPAPAEIPFGFDTRVLALWRAGNADADGGKGIVRLIRRVAVLAAFVILISGTASLREYQQTRDMVEPGSNEFAIADSAIQDEFSQ